VPDRGAVTPVGQALAPRSSDTAPTALVGYTGLTVQVKEADPVSPLDVAVTFTW
jgi:hypothetical protein